MKRINIGGCTFGICYNGYKSTYEYGQLVPKFKENNVAEYSFHIYGTDDSEAECEKRIYEEFGGQDHEEENR